MEPKLRGLDNEEVKEEHLLNRKTYRFPPYYGNHNWYYYPVYSNGQFRQDSGYSKIYIYNCNTEKRPVNIWVFDGSRWNFETTLNQLYDDSGTCPVGEPYELELKDGLWHVIVAVDEGALECGENDPQKVACQRYTSPSILGNSNGPTHPDPIIVP